MVERKPMKVKCPECEQKKEKVDMEYDEKSKRWYCKGSCWEDFLKKKEFKEKESREKDELVDLIVEIHGLQGRSSVPSTFYPFLEELRNDSRLFGRIEYKYKQGFDYTTIRNCYHFCKKDIAWGKANREFSNIFRELKYSLGIVRNNIENSIRAEKKTMKQRSDFEDLKKDSNRFNFVSEKIKDVQTSNYQQREEQIDITTLFD